jgi:PAS domain S-box-containing protein
LRASGETYEKNQGAAFRLNSPSQSWLGAVGLFVVVGIAYFLAARVGVVLGVSQGVPIFWPAAGIAVGAFITLAPNARLPVTVAVVAATIASGILIGRSLSLTITFAFFNTGEALLTAWLIERWFGRAFILGTVRQVLGFVVASAVSEAVAASGAGIVVHFLEPTTSSAHAWRLWFASCSLGIFTVAPLVIGLGEIVRELPPRRELIEGTVGLATLAAVSVFVISLPQSPWATALPVALVLPIVLWIAVRCRPAFAAAAMFIVALAVIWSTTFDAGHFADASIALSDRILAAQTLVLAAALLALVLAALFAERRRSEAELKQSNNRLQLALDCAELGTWNLQLGTGRFDNDVRDRHIHGHGQETPPKTLAEMRSQVHPGDLSKLDAAFRELRHACGSCRTEYRLAPRTDQEDAGRERWVTLEGTVVRRADGRPEQLLGVTRDITERKLAEEAVRTSEERLRRVSDNADVGLIRCSRDWLYLSANPAYAKIAGKPLDQIMGRPMAEVMGAEAVETIRPYVERVLRGEHVIYEAEVPYAGAGTRYMHVSYTPDTDATGQIVGWIACITDITERKRAENALRQREAELGEAQRLAHIGSWFWEAETDALVASDELLRIFGVDPATRHVLTLRDQRDRWHPVDDWERLKAAIQRTMQTGLGYELELRAFRNEVPIWITAGGAAVRNSNGQIVGLRGTVQDITQRKQAELALADRNLQLRLAEMAGLIGSYAYDSLSEIGQVSSGYAAIHGLPEGTTEIARSEWLARVHAEDVERLQLCRSEALRERREEYKVDYRIIRHDGEVRWIESRVFIMYGSDATGHRLTGVNIDVTERKRAEALYKENSTRLADALTAGQVIAFEWNSVPGLIQRSDNAIDILGRDDQDCWVGSRQNDFLNNVHPDDRTSLKTCIGELSPRSPSYAVTFRYVRPDGRTVWLEETARGEFDTTGKLSRVPGADARYHSSKAGRASNR